MDKIITKVIVKITKMKGANLGEKVRINPFI